MIIEIPKSDRFVFTGKNVLEALQNKSMATIDLLVRECIQNSLDAYDRENNYNFVKMNFIINKFNPGELTPFLGSAGKIMEMKINNLCDEFICIEDTKTSGLDGKLAIETENNKSDGNFEKLVYQIGQAQTKEGSGGSWGYGKSVYYRLGIGLVIFYSRYKDTDGVYKSRLAATFIENQEKKDSILSSISSDNRGIAWFGEKSHIDESRTVPVTDEKKINEILKVFNINPYGICEKGTKVIIPFIDTKELLTDINNRNDYDNSNYYWKNSFVDTLKNQILLWYSPRINNPYYKACLEKPYLKVLVNSKLLNIGDNYPIYSIQRELYNCSLNTIYKKDRNLYQHEDDDEYYMFNSKDIYSKDITYKGMTLGAVSFTKYKKDQLCKNNIIPTPYVYLGKYNEDESKNRPIISFTRSPGMIVYYHVSGSWAEVPSTDVDEYLVGLFVLNSNQNLLDYNYKLEEYVRVSELADHTSWDDYPFENEQLRVISKCKLGTKRKILEVYKPADEKKKDKPVSGMSQRLGNLFLPQGYNSTRNIVTSGGSSSRPVIQGTGKRVSNDVFKVVRMHDYKFNSVLVDFSLEIGKNTRICSINSFVNAKGKSVTETLPGGYPIIIDDYHISSITAGKVARNLNDEIKIEKLDNKLIFSRINNYNYSLKITGTVKLVNSDHKYVAQLKLMKGE